MSQVRFETRTHIWTELYDYFYFPLCTIFEEPKQEIFKIILTILVLEKDINSARTAVFFFICFLLFPPDIFSSSSKGDLLKEANCALLNFLVEAARQDFSPETLQTFLETKVNWPRPRAKKLCDAYLDSSLQIQASLANIGFHPPHIVDVQWTLNHNVKVRQWSLQI